MSVSLPRYFWRTLIIIGVVGLLGWVAYATIQLRSESNRGDKKLVLTTFTVLADMARSVAGDHITVESLTKPGAEIHGYEPTPQDLVRLQDADIILDNGMNLEKWAAKLYQNSGNVPHITLTEGIEPMSIAEGPYKDKPNPHAWMSPENALVYVDNITEALVQIDEPNANYYKQRADEYKTRIKEVDTTLRRELNTLPTSNRYLTSCEGAFSYLIRDYGLKELYLWPINADAQGTPQQIRHVVETVRENKIPAVFCESTVNDKAQRQVAQESGSRFGGVFYVDSLSGKDGPTPTYLKMLEYNADVLTRGLRE